METETAIIEHEHMRTNNKRYMEIITKKKGKYTFHRERDKKGDGRTEEEKSKKIINNNGKKPEGKGE